MLGPNTLGTFILFIASALLILVTLSSPFNPAIYFLAANVQASVSVNNVAGVIRLGVFGYCIETQNKRVCSNPSIGYVLDPNVLLGLSLPESLKVQDSVFKALTYPLIIHPIAAFFASLSALAGIISHIREFQRTCWTSMLSSFAASLTLVVLIFDFVIFGIFRARMNAIEPRSNRAAFGHALWLTLIAWLLLAFSGCFFCAGRCFCGHSRRPRRHSTEMDQRSLSKESKQNF